MATYRVGDRVRVLRATYSFHQDGDVATVVEVGGHFVGVAAPDGRPPNVGVGWAYYFRDVEPVAEEAPPALPAAPPRATPARVRAQHIAERAVAKVFKTTRRLAREVYPNSYRAAYQAARAAQRSAGVR